MSLSTQGSVPNFTPTPGQLSALKGVSVGSLTDQQRQSALTTVPTSSSPYSPAQGSNPGHLPSSSPLNAPTTPVKSTTDVQGNTTTYHAPKSDPNILAQQQMLNQKYQAGLVEDGISGPKTQAAISKYLTSGTQTGLPPDDPSYKFNTATGQANPNYKDPNAPVTPPTPQVGTTTQNAQTVLNTGNQTPNEKDTQGNVIQKSNTESQAYIDAQAQANDYLNQEKQLEQEYQDKKMNINGTAGFLTQASGLQGQLADKYNAVGAKLASNYGAATNLINAANTQQGLQNTEANTAYAGAQAQAGRATGAAESVQNGSLNQQGTYGAPTFNPLTGEYSSSGNYGSGPEAQSNVQGVKDAQNIINAIASNAPAITTNLQRAQDLATQANLDPNSPLLTGLQHALSNGLITNQALTAFNSTLTALNQNLTEAGQAPIDPATITPSALAQLAQTIPNNLKATQQSKQSFINSFNSGSSSGSTGGTMFGNFF